MKSGPNEDDDKDRDDDRDDRDDAPTPLEEHVRRELEKWEPPSEWRDLWRKSD